MSRSLPIALLASAALLAAAAPSAHAAIYMKYDGIKGNVSHAATGKTMAAEVLASR